MPSKNNGIIARNNLMRLFGKLSGKRIICVCAPAGYGKTVAVRQWVDSAGARAIISLDEYDNNPAHFCRRFCAALLASQPQNSAISEIISHPSFSGAPDEFALRAVDALLPDEQSFLIADDLHFVTDERTLRLLALLLSRIPENFRIILISRENPPPCFSDLLNIESCAWVTAEQLLFSEEEIMLLYKSRGNSLTTEQVKDISRFTGGWAIGIGALLLSGGNPDKETLDVLEQFIRRNVWDKWDERAREFMLKTAAARELSPSLCTALTGIEDSKQMLDEFVRSGAFVYLSSDGMYYYHRLFQEFLTHMQEERGEGYALSLLEKEGRWHLSHQDFYSAAECFIRCKNHDGIAECFDLLETADRNDFVIEKMLPLVQKPEIAAAAEKYPFLYYLMSWAAFAEGRSADTVMHMDNYYARYAEIAERDPANAHNIFFMRIMDFRVPLGGIVSKIASLPVKPDTKRASGSITMNMPTIHRCTRDFSELSSSNTEEYIAHIKDIVDWLFGEETELLIESMAAGILYEQGDLEKAYKHAVAANAEIKDHLASESKFCAMIILVNILDALDRVDEAERVVADIISMIERDRAYYLNNNFRAFMLRRKLGDTESALKWISANGAVLYANVTLHGMYSALTTCAAYITAGDYDAAIILLTKTLKLAMEYNRPLDIIEANILLSIAYRKKNINPQEEAMGYFNEAVSLAYRYGFTQIFANNGAGLFEIMRQFQGDAANYGDEDIAYADFIQKLGMEIFKHESNVAKEGHHEHSARFTDKQKTVMRLLCEGKRYKDIAEVMGIKLPTLRSHISLIYRKLDVMSEMDAIRKIKSLGIL